DPMNEFDPYAVAVRTSDRKDRYLIGYVPRYLARDVQRLLSECEPRVIELVVERVNRGAPLQQRLLCRMRACWPEGFQPCGDPAFLPIPSGAPIGSNV